MRPRKLLLFYYALFDAHYCMPHGITPDDSLCTFLFFIFFSFFFFSPPAWGFYASPTRYKHPRIRAHERVSALPIYSSSAATETLRHVTHCVFEVHIAAYLTPRLQSLWLQDVPIPVEGIPTLTWSWKRWSKFICRGTILTRWKHEFSKTIFPAPRHVFFFFLSKNSSIFSFGKFYAESKKHRTRIVATTIFPKKCLKSMFDAIDAAIEIKARILSTDFSDSQKFPFFQI